MAYRRYKAASRISNLIQGICTCEVSRLFHTNEFLNQLKDFPLSTTFPKCYMQTTLTDTCLLAKQFLVKNRKQNKKTPLQLIQNHFKPG